LIYPSLVNRWLAGESRPITDFDLSRDISRCQTKLYSYRPKSGSYQSSSQGQATGSTGCSHGSGNCFPECPLLLASSPSGRDRPKAFHGEHEFSASASRPNFPYETSPLSVLNAPILLANSNQWYFNNLVKRPCHKTPYRCPHRLNLSSQSSRSCALPNIKALKDKDLEFANSIPSFFSSPSTVKVWIVVFCTPTTGTPPGLS
jgi:hypothetical protein